jgi:signal peptidase II
MLAMSAVAVLVTDQAVKLILRGGRQLGLGPFGRLRAVPGRLWVSRLGTKRPNVLWLWVVPACLLVVGTALVPSIGVFAGLVLGGSLSNAVEVRVRGSVTDYVCLRCWPAFNLADIALVAGALGIAVVLARMLGGAV